jgi:hypothetical protein
MILLVCKFFLELLILGIFFLIDVIYIILVFILLLWAIPMSFCYYFFIGFHINFFIVRGDTVVLWL